MLSIIDGDSGGSPWMASPCSPLLDPASMERAAAVAKALAAWRSCLACSRCSRSSRSVLYTR